MATKAQAELMDLIEILYSYKDGDVSIDQLEEWAIVRLQEAMDKMKLMDMICGGTIAVGVGDITEAEFKEQLFESPHFKRFGEEKP